MNNASSRNDAIYQLDGKVPVGKAVPFGLQHILAMFVGNIAPIIIVAGACKLDKTQTAMLIQSAMVVAGLGTLIQLYPIWRIGSGLPIVMGISFTFVSGVLVDLHVQEKLSGNTDGVRFEEIVVLGESEVADVPEVRRSPLRLLFERGF